MVRAHAARVARVHLEGARIVAQNAVAVVVGADHHNPEALDRHLRRLELLGDRIAAGLVGEGATEVRTVEHVPWLGDDCNVNRVRELVEAVVRVDLAGHRHLVAGGEHVLAAAIGEHAAARARAALVANVREPVAEEMALVMVTVTYLVPEP